MGLRTRWDASRTWGGSERTGARKDHQEGPPASGTGRVGPGRPGLDPGLEGFQVLLGKPFLSGRHLQIAHVGDGLVEQAGAGPARLHCRTAVAATQHTLPGSEIQARGADGAVAAQALVLEDLRDAIGVAGPGRRRPARRSAEHGDGEEPPEDSVPAWRGWAVKCSRRDPIECLRS